MFRWMILILFFVSGFTGLLYEIVWIRIFGLIYGNTTLAISSVLAAFMSGMAAGSLFLGRYADQIRNHLKLFAGLEMGIALTAPLIILLKTPLESLFTLLHVYFSNQITATYLIKFLLSFVIMLPATFLMGGTLPVLSRVLIRHKENLGRGVALLYGINTLGAVFGTLLTGFFLIRLLGVTNTIFLAVLMDIIIALFAFLIAGKGQIQVLHKSKPVRDRLFYGDSQIRLITLVMALSGFAALGYEVVWSRILVFALTNSVYAFAVMLATFLIGITSGSLVGSRFIDRLQRSPYWLGLLQIGTGVSAMLAAFLLANLNAIHHSIFSADPQTTWIYWNGIRFLESLLIMFLPTFLMGISFPLASKIIIPRVNRTGEGIGLVYFFNTLGGVFGSFLTGFFLISFLGTAPPLFTLVLINIAAGVWLVWFSTNKALTIKPTVYVGIIVIVLFLMINLIPTTIFSNAYSLVESDCPIIDFREGIEGTVTVHQGPPPEPETRRIDVDGLNVAGTSFMLRTLQILQGHLPNLVYGPAQKVLQIGFGTGQTSHSALAYPVQNFTVVEISRDVLELSAKYFVDINKGVLENPNFNYVISDGKNFVKYTSEKYDIIMNDANYAVATASASLFTRDHFLMCQKKLKPGGILSSWMTTDLDPQDFAIVLKTFQEVFPHSLLWMAPNCINKQVVLMGSTQPIRLDVAWIQDRFKQPDIRQDLASINIHSVYDLLSCLILDEEGIRSISESAAVNSDNHPILEYSTKAIRARDLCAFQNLAKLIRRPADLSGLLINQFTLPSFEKDFERYTLASRKLYKGVLISYQGNTKQALETLLEGSQLIPESQLAAEFFRHMDVITAQLAFEIQQNPHLLMPRLKFVRHQIAAQQYETALKSLDELVLRFPSNPLLYYERSRCLLAQNQLSEAQQDLEKAVGLYADLSGAWYLLGVVYQETGKIEKARESYQRALQLDTRIYEAYNALGILDLNANRIRNAQNYFMKSIHILEYQPEIYGYLGQCSFSLKDYRQAVRFYEEGLHQGLHSPRAFAVLAYSCYFLQDFERAAFYIQQAISLDDTDSEYFYNLGNIYMMQKKISEASGAYRKAIQISKDQPDYFNNLALCYREMGDPSRALEIIQEGLHYHGQSELLHKNEASLKEIIKSKRSGGTPR